MNMKRMQSNFAVEDRKARHDLDRGNLPLRSAAQSDISDETKKKKRECKAR